MKNNKEKIILLVCVVFFIVGFLSEDFFISQKDKVIFCDVGQGDGALINLRGKQILIDGGPDNKFVGCVGKYMSFFDRNIEYLIISHPDKDHFVGAIEILKRYNVEKVLINGDKSEISEYKEFLKLAKDKLAVADENSDIDVGKAKIDFINRGGYKDTNDNSLVFKFIYGKKSILFTGDISERAEADLLAQSDISLKSNILKLAHHGSKTSSGEYFLRAVNPDLAIVSVGINNKFGHPSYRVIKRLEKLGIDYKRTDEIGDIVIAL